MLVYILAKKISIHIFCRNLLILFKKFLFKNQILSKKKKKRKTNRPFAQLQRITSHISHSFIYSNEQILSKNNHESKIQSL